MGEVAERTPYVDLSGWPPGTRLLVRREIPHPGAQLTFTDVHGYRYPWTITNHPSLDIAFLEALHRGRGRCEQAIRDLKATGLAHLPSAHFAWNEAWVTAVLIAADLLAWTRGLLLPASWRAVTPDRLRYRLFHTAGRLIHLARRTVVRRAASTAIRCARQAVQPCLFATYDSKAGPMSPSDVARPPFWRGTGWPLRSPWDSRNANPTRNRHRIVSRVRHPSAAARYSSYRSMSAAVACNKFVPYVCRYFSHCAASNSTLRVVAGVYRRSWQNISSPGAISSVLIVGRLPKGKP